MKAILGNILNGLGLIHQYSIWDIEHCYRADFYIPALNLIIEVDGKYGKGKFGHNYPNGTDKDHIRNKELEEAGYNVLRFWEDEFDEESVMEAIRNCLVEYEMKIIKEKRKEIEQ